MRWMDLSYLLAKALLVNCIVSGVLWAQDNPDPPEQSAGPVVVETEGRSPEPSVSREPAAPPADEVRVPDAPRPAIAEPEEGGGQTGPVPVMALPEDESVEDIPALGNDATAGAPDIDTTGSDEPPIAGDIPGQNREGPESPTAAISGESVTEVIPETRPAQARPFRILSGEVLPGTTARLGWSPDIQIAGLSQPTPVLVVNGNKPGPVLCMTGAVHGDELNGIEIIRRMIYQLNPNELSGTVVGIPIVNLQGFQQGSRYLADRRDLNRYFPGSPDGSLAHRIAHSLFEQVILNCDMLVDIHTGSLKRTNLPQLRADMDNPEVVELSKGFDSMAVVHSAGGPGMLRTAAIDAGIPAITMEVGESMRIQEEHISAGVNSLTSLMEKQGMTSRLFQWGKPEPVYYKSHWIRADHGGILFSAVKLGAYVTEGTVLGTVSDPITNEQFPIRADADGRIIGMAVDQVVMAGFAAYHLGSRAETAEGE